MRFSLALSVIGTISLLCGCASTGHNTVAGAAVGTGIGALSGTIIGSQTGHAGNGMAIGAATGALAGGLIGNAEDARDERDAAIAQASNEQIAQMALTNSDLLLMTQSGVGDDVIVEAVLTRGGRFDLSPLGIVHLKNSGVSDRVILAIQKAQSQAPSIVVAGSGTHVVPAVTEVVVVPARPMVGVGVVLGPRPYWGPAHHRMGPPYRRGRW